VPAEPVGVARRESGTPVTALSGAEQDLRLSEALTRMPRACLEVVRLRHFERLPLETVAARLGTSLERTRRLWVTALRRLRGVVGEP
jgi:RNA polymerase sigma factor (sigma-70 family)